MTTVNKFRPVTKLKKTNFKVLIPQCQTIYNGLFNNQSLFPNCNPTLAALLLLLTSWIRPSKT